MSGPIPSMGVAQPGSALEWGSSGPRFESGRPDQREAVGCHRCGAGGLLACLSALSFLASRAILRDGKLCRLGESSCPIICMAGMEAASGGMTGQWARIRRLPRR